MTTTVKNVMKIGKFNQGMVVAGEKGLDRIIKYIDVLEVPDITEWVDQGVLLFTTGYAIQGRADIQLSLIKSLHLNNAAGLVIKENRFLKEIPKEMIQLADELKVPIISIPEHIPYVEVTHPILEKILSTQIKMSLTSNRIMEIIDKGAELSEKVILNEINQLKNGLQLTSPYMISFIPFKSDSELSDYMNMDLIQKSNKIIGFKNEGIFTCIISLSIIGDEEEWKDGICNILFKEVVKGGKTLFCLNSNIINSFQEIKYEYMNLKKNLNYLRNIPFLQDRIVFYDDVIYFILIKESIDSKENISLIKKALEPILKLESEERDIMIDTLYSYVNNCGNKTQAANDSYVHRNTFYYRMDKLVGLLNSDLESQKNIFKYKLILDLYFIISNL